MIKKTWYDWIFPVYFILGDNYLKWRKDTINLINLGPNEVIIDLCSGTGRNVELLSQRIPSSSHIIGVDTSLSMQKFCRKKFRTSQNIHFLKKSANDLSKEDISQLVPIEDIGCVICTLGLSVIPKWREAFFNAFSLLKTGGMFILFDIHSKQSNFACKCIKCFAKADLSRETWIPLQEASTDFHFIKYSTHFFDIVIAHGIKT